MASRKLRVGLLGGGDVAQIVHLPTLQLLSHMYTTLAVCDVSKKVADHCATKFQIPLSTTNPEDLFNHPDLDVIFILTSDEYHAPYTISALQAGKHVMLEKPMSLSVQSGQSIVDAERTAPNNARVFVGYMRRYAPSLATFRRELAALGTIRYARVREIIGPNAYFISQSGTFPFKLSPNHPDTAPDIPAAAVQDRQARLDALLAESWGKPISALSRPQLDYAWLLHCLGSHGLGVMRDVLGGPPSAVVASTHHSRWFTTLFTYKNKTPAQEPFTVTYELGTDGVPRFDSHVAVYGDNRTVTVQYDTPFVKGLGITVTVDEFNEHGEQSTRVLQRGYEDPYTVELKELWECLVQGKEIMTSAEDAMTDLHLFKMMLDKYPEELRGAGKGEDGEYQPLQP